MDALLQQMAGQATSCSNGASSTTPAPTTGAPVTGQMVLLDMFFPGFSTFSAFVQKNLNIDLNLYIPLVLICGILTFAWQYFSTYVWDLVDSYMMSVVDVRTDDEIYNMLMGWVAAQKFAQGARRFVVNTNLNSRFWWLWRYDYEDEEEEDGSEEGSYHSSSSKGGSKKALAYTPTFGSHWFWYKGRLLCFRRSQSREMGFALPSEREEISIKCFGRNPWILKELLLEARQVYMKRDEAKTLIYRGTTKGSGSEPTWQRCMARTSRPFSTVILNEKVKKDLIEDVTDYLNPATRRWYANRGIPYRRGYLLHGPPGTGKSSLSLALAGFFKMRIYIVSLSSIAANEENLASLFSELPRRCVVLLEDIDTAGLTHTREGDKAPVVDPGSDDMVPGQLTPGDGTGTTGAAQPSGRLSLSGLLNILDGVASQEGRVLIMTTNHMEKLDKALIRPGRVDMIVEFGRADKEMTAAIFRAIFAPLEGDEVDTPSVPSSSSPTAPTKDLLSPEAAAAAAKKEAAIETQRLHNEAAFKTITELATRFASKIPAHEFSPAEIQGFLLKHKRNAQAAVEGAEQWVVEARKEKVEKELKEAREKREKEEKEAKEAKEKQEEEKKAEKNKKSGDEKEEKSDKDKKKEKKKSKKKSKQHHKRSSKKSRRYDSDSSSSSSSSDSSSSSESESESESEREIIKKKSSKRKPSSKKTKEPATPPSLVKEDTIKIVVDEVPSVNAAMASSEDDENTEVAVEAIKGLDALPHQVSITEVRSAGSEDGKDSGYGTP